MIELVRDHIGNVIVSKIAGPDGHRRRARIYGTPGPRRWRPEDPIWRVHADGAMFIGGIRALLYQSLHPRAMAAVAEHSGYRSDPWGRLQRTSGFIAATTYGTIEEAERAVRIVRAHHRHVIGVTDDGEPYAADDPELLLWVHCAEVDSFLKAHQRFGISRLTAAEQDTYVAQAAWTGRALGARGVPESVPQLDATLAAFRPQLRATDHARAVARFILYRPPVSLGLAVPYGVLAAGAVSLMPWWSRPGLRLPLLPVTEATTVRAVGTAASRTISWAMAGQRSS